MSRQFILFTAKDSTPIVSWAIFANDDPHVHAMVFSSKDHQSMTIYSFISLHSVGSESVENAAEDSSRDRDGVGLTWITREERVERLRETGLKRRLPSWKAGVRVPACSMARISSHSDSSCAYIALYTWSAPGHDHPVVRFTEVGGHSSLPWQTHQCYGRAF